MADKRLARAVMRSHVKRWRVAVAVFAAAIAGNAAAATIPTDAEIRKLIEERVEGQKWATGIVVGITDPQGRRIISYGSFGRDDERRVGGDTVFEIASLTKILTALLLADMAQRGEVALDDPAAKCLPREVILPARNGRQITFADLATHTSGLPLRPTNLASQTGMNKYAGYTAAQMFAALSSFTLTNDPGTHFEYSNWGFALLGQALARCAGEPYEVLLRQRVTEALSMSDTTHTPTAAMRRRLARGHDQQLRPVGNEGLGFLLPSGGLYSTANDMLNLIEAFMGRRKSGLAAAMARMPDTRRPTDDAATQIALGWRITTHGSQRFLWSHGRADGYRSYMAYDPDAAIGVVAFANAATNMGVDDIGQYVIDPRTQVARSHPRVQLPVASLDAYTGSYLFTDGAVFTITRDGEQLVSQMTGQDPVALYATGEREFYPEEIEARIVFDAPVDGHAPLLTLHQNNETWPAQRIKQ